MSGNKLDLRKTSLSPGLIRVVPEDLLSDGGVALATWAAEKEIVDGSGEPGTAGILRKSSIINGFTIIEVMLFLAISAALAVGILASAGSAINTQRYRDAINSLANYLQTEYNNTINVQSDRSTTLSCSVAGITDTAGGEERGTSECTIVGRYLQTTDGWTITSSTVFASVDGSRESNDKAALIKSNLFISPLDAVSSYQLEWGTQIVKAPPVNTVYAPLNVLIVRSPSSGAIKTYVGTGSSDSPASLVATSDQQTDTNLCVEPDGLFTGVHIGVVVIRDAANASAVKLTEAGVC